jgi:signal peptidase I
MNVSPAKTVIYFVTALLITVVLVRTFLVDSFIVKGNSMAPTIVDGDYVFVDKLAYVFKEEPKREDIVVFNFRDLPQTKIIKRIKALPQEWVVIVGNSISVRADREDKGVEVGKLYDEKIQLPGATSSSMRYRLDPHEYFVIGDNGLGSVDSRELGPVDIYMIDGKVFATFRLSKMKFMLFP